MIQTALDKAKIRDSFAAAAASYDGAAALQRQVGLELLRRFPVVSGSGVLLDLGSGTGFMSAQIHRSAAVDRLLAIDLALPMLEISRGKHSALAIQHICADAERLPLANDSVAQIYSNLALQWLQDLSAIFEELKRALRPEGQLVFSTFGPATLKELKLAWAAVDDAVHVNEFVEADRLAKVLSTAGFCSLEMETTIHVCRYPTVMALMQELKGLGAHNINNGRKRRPTTKTELQRMMQSYQQQMSGPVIEASYEIIMIRAVA